MKKKCFLLVALTLVVWFSFSHLANAKEKGKLFRVPHDQPRVIQKGNPEAEQTKRERYIQERDQKEEKHARLSSIAREEQPDKPNAVDIALDSTYIYFQPDYRDDLVITGRCHNAGTSSAVFVKVNFNLYDSNWNFIGYDYSYVWGGSNSQLTSSGIYTNALGAGDYGFFKVWTNYDYNNVMYYNYWFTWDTYAHTAAYAKLAFDGDVNGYDYLGNLALSGLIKNSSSSYVTYFTKTAFAVFNTSDTKVVDVDFSYVNGSTYNYGIGSTDTAIYPYESRPFLVTFPEATYSGTSDTFLYAFEWDEARASSLPEKDPPFGSFDTPIDGSTVASSIPVTGWALDDSGVESVKIYRGFGGTLVYIGDAQLVEGARPDVAAAYPQYPNKTKAGWGYMMLTNFLPDGGNGTFVLYAIATDGVGKTTTLGTKTIYCDNAHAVKPFGAIDTPTQGGTASGDSFINWGWVLTPQPNSIPTDGSTINVYVDGVNIGHPTYNVYRADIANSFQGYANSNGAIGYFYLDTTAYSNVVHTIQWTARDSGGNSDGIGSRYFSISNTGSSRTGKMSHTYQPKQKTNFLNFSQIIDLPVDYSVPVQVKRGYNEDVIPQEVQPDETGINRVVIYELERVVIYLSGKTAAGYHVVNNGLVSLPVGSTLNREKGIFYWQPGPGYLGRYRLVFVETAPDGTMTRKNIIVEIVPQK
ncbi:MAG: hypothetical protein GTO45_28245 [Candidatus Aminicenantes bacterium]|nr:hypothetical protein [Candidatus Aminicenantes bacterium]NIM82692.1 hypothetical protein [Candidatus Aminicenantes bacterium]NIN22065.1 hypothetical protein [Candidatus Aminicenantes bacterium]NIN45822.1 hypothetical protein [Candidatus Aminicenantes bacterium]NIN88660.1 hypothetical protein [Candidatus Aminicenantes bacterium]